MQQFSWQKIKGAIKETWDSLPDDQKQFFKSKFKEKFGKISEEDVSKAGGNREEMIALLQKNYGYDKDRAERELDKWENEMSKEK